MGANKIKDILNVNIDKVRGIFEYKRVDSVDYFLVLWEDNTRTWTKLSNLNCKSKICEFIENCLQQLKKKEEEEKVATKQKYENDMLQKIAASNTISSKTIESATTKNYIVNDIIKKTQKPNNINGEYFPFVNYRPGPKPILIDSTPPQSLQSQILIHKKISAQPLKIYQDTTKCNVMRLKVGDSIITELCFYYKENHPVTVVELEKTVFVPFNCISAHLYNLYVKNSEYFGLFCAEKNMGSSVKAFNAFEAELRDSELFMLYMVDKSFFLLYFPCSNRNLFRLSPLHKIIIMRIDNDPFLWSIYNSKAVRLSNSLWENSKYEAGSTFLSEFLFTNQKLPDKAPTLFIGEKNSYVGKHILKIVRKSTGLINDFRENCNIVVDEPYYDYIHQIKDLSLMLRKSGNFFGIEKYKVIQFFQRGGVFTVSEKFVESCGSSFFDFLNKLGMHRSWVIKINSRVYNILQARYHTFESSGYDSQSLKNNFKMLKANVIDSSADDFRRFLEKSMWKDGARFFYCIEKDGWSTNVISLAEAMKIITL